MGLIRRRRKDVDGIFILPAYMRNAHIMIKHQERVVFDSEEYKEIPVGIQSAIHCYGYPGEDIMRIYQKEHTPLVYHVITCTVEEEYRHIQEVFMPQI